MSGLLKGILVEKELAISKVGVQLKLTLLSASAEYYVSLSNKYYQGVHECVKADLVCAVSAILMGLGVKVNPELPIDLLRPMIDTHIPLEYRFSNISPTLKESDLKLGDDDYNI